MNPEYNQPKLKQFKIAGMKSASCVSRIENTLKNMVGVQIVEINFLSKTLSVTANPSLNTLKVIRALKGLGYKAKSLNSKQHDKTYLHQHNDQKILYQIILGGGLGLLFMQLNVLGWIPKLNTLNGQFVNFGWVVVAFIVLSYSGKQIYISAYQACKNHTNNRNTLPALGAGIAWLYSLIAVIFAPLLPRLAQHIYIETALFIVTLSNIGMFLESRLLQHTFEETSPILQTLPTEEQTQNTLPPLEHLTDNIARFFIPAVMIIAIFTALFWFNIVSSPQIIFMLMTSIAVLIIACPHAINLAIPVSIKLGLAKIAEHGIHMPDTDLLQKTGKLTIVIFDKTGTLTTGLSKVTGIYPCAQQTEHELLSLAASLNTNSKHPVAAAIMQAAIEQNCNLWPMTHFNTLPGRGVKATLAQQVYYLGNVGLMHQQLVELSSMRELGEQLANSGQTPIYLAVNTQILGIIAITDSLRTDAKTTISELQQQGIRTIMVTGDHEDTAHYIAEKLGIRDVISQVLPEQKAEQIKLLQEAGEVVGMVGNPINDAPALAQADVGFVLNSALENDVDTIQNIQLNNSLLNVVDTLYIAQRTLGNMKQNLWGAYAYNIVGITIAAGMLFPFTAVLPNPLIAAIATTFVPILVIGNALRLRTLKMKRTKT